MRHWQLTAVAALTALAACTAEISVHGITPDPEDLAALEPGRTSKADVESKLGTPSTVGTFDTDVWYYMSERREQYFFLDPKIVERKIIALTFDGQEKLADVITYTEADGQDIRIVSRKTPTAGKELTLLQQLFGNLGRFQSSE